MTVRIDPGPVFAFETRADARRPAVYAARSLFVAALLAGLGVVWYGEVGAGWSPLRRVLTFRDMAQIGQNVYFALAQLQLAMILLVAPAATAGSICMDRARGTLAHMLVTDLSDAEIVLGKLAARLAPVVATVAAAVPVAALAGLLGGVDFGALAGLFAISLALAVFGCALALVVSVHAKSTHEVLMTVYAVEGAWLLALPVWQSGFQSLGWAPPPDWCVKGNPFALAFAPYESSGRVDPGDYAAFGAGALLISAALSAIAVARLRGRTLSSPRGRGLARGRAAGRCWLPGPSLDGNPVLWREWHRNRPSRLARVLWGVVLGLGWLLASWGAWDVARGGVPGFGLGLLAAAMMIATLFGLLILGAASATVYAEERARGSLEVLMATPLPTSAIVAGKWWGAFRGVLLLAPLPACTMAAWALAEPAVPAAMPAGVAGLVIPLQPWERLALFVVGVGQFLASGAAVVSLGLALATWIPRPGRAVGLSVAAFVLAGIGWVIMVQWLDIQFRLNAPWASTYDAGPSFVLMSLSPVFGPAAPMNVASMFFLDPGRPRIWSALGLTALGKLIAAGLLYLAAWSSFDRRLGRMPETFADPRGPRPAEAPSAWAG